jgi:hypothetical protein
VKTFNQIFLRNTIPHLPPPPAGQIALQYDAEQGRVAALDHTGAAVPVGGSAASGTPVNSVKATQTLTGDGTNVANAATVTIGTKVYTFQDTLTNVDGHVKIGANAAASLTNLFHAINASGGTVGTDYATATTANTDVVATNPTGTTVLLTAILGGTLANAVATTETSAHLSFGAATLTGGVDATTALAGELMFDASYGYIAIRDVLVSTIVGWKKFTLAGL